MEPVPVLTMRPMTPADCRRNVLLPATGCVMGFGVALLPVHQQFTLRWLTTVLALLVGCLNGFFALFWLLLSRCMGQTITFRIGPRSHTYWQRTITFIKPMMHGRSANMLIPNWVSASIASVLTLVICMATVFAISILAQAEWVVGLTILAITVPFIVLAVLCWKRVAQDKELLARARNIAP